MTEPDWLFKPSLKPAKAYSEGAAGDGYYLELVDGQVDLRSQTMYRHVVRHIINESGVQNASEISVSYDPAYQKIIFHKILLIRDGKRINQLSLQDIKVIQEEADAERYQYNGMKRAYIILKGTRKDDRIEYAYSMVGFNPVYKNRFTDKFYFSADDEIGNYFQTYIVPSDRKLLVNYFNEAPKPVTMQKGDLIIYHWNNPPLKIYETQNQVPGWFDNYPYVEISEFQRWNDVANWGLDLFNHYQYDIPDELKTKITQWRKLSKGDKEMFANFATRFVQDEIRYLGMESGVYSHKPHLPSEVFKQRFGDCKDKALLLTTILRQENIPAFVALVSTFRRSQLQFATPSIEDFDHAIVAVERSSGYLFIDATMNFQRGEFSTTYVPNYGFALLLKQGQDRLEAIEPGYPNTTEITERLFLPLKDSSRMSVETIYKGGAADQFRADVSEMSAKELSLSCVNYYAKHLDGIRLVKNVETVDDSVHNELTLLEEYVIPPFWKKKEDGKMSIDIYIKSVNEKIPDPTGAYAGGPIAISFPLTLKYQLILDLYEKYEFPIEDLHIKTSSYQFDFSSTVNGNQVELNYYYKTFRDHIPQSEVAAYKEEYGKIEEYLSFNFSRGGTSKEQTGPSQISDPAVNWLMVLIATVLVGGLILLFRKLDSSSPKYARPSFGNERIGGWVAFLGVSLVLSLLFQLYNFVESRYFDHSTWIAIERSGGKYLQFVFVVELMYSLFTASFATALFYWLIKRRDIFPGMFIAYCIGFLAGQLLLIILYVIAEYLKISIEVPKENVIAFIRSLIYAAIWTSYLRRSERVKNTFVVPKKEL